MPVLKNLRTVGYPLSVLTNQVLLFLKLEITFYKLKLKNISLISFFNNENIINNVFKKI